MSLKIVVIDYDIGNVRSIINALEKVNATPILSRNKETIINADGVILPGVGAFPHAMQNLQKYGLVEIIKSYVDTNKPLLGICLGMQMLVDESNEFGITQGLGLIEGKVIKLPVQNEEFEKLPHVSWNEIQQKQLPWEGTILDCIENKTDMYFVHSYIVVPQAGEHILSTTTYSDFEFCSAIKKNNVYGCQFHPEKSADAGLKILENFAKICKGDM